VPWLINSLSNVGGGTRPEQENASHLCGAFFTSERNAHARVRDSKAWACKSQRGLQMFAFARTKKKLMQLAKAIQ
jgi:hypothetical protein